MILPLQWAVHMQTEQWRESPEAFDPTRFLNEKLEFFTPPNFLPFQTGFNEK